MRCVVIEPDWSWRWIAATLKSRGEWVVGREGEARGFLSGATHSSYRSCTQNRLADSLVFVTSEK